MKTPIWLVIGLLWGASLARAEFREWTAADGRTLLAEFVKLEGDQVTIKRRNDGRQFTLSLDKLSEEDQLWVKETGMALQKAEDAKPAEALADSPLAALVTGEWERHESEGLAYRFFGERKLLRETSSGVGGQGGPDRVPLVVCLHGKNGDVMTPENPWPANAFASRNNLQERPCFIFAPQAPKDDETWRGKNGQAVVEIVEDMLKHLPIDENRVYLLGYSMGAYGTFHLLATEPKLFAAAVPVAGGGDPGGVRAHRKVPVWVFHGEKDDVVPIEQSERMVEAMKRARAPVKFTPDPKADHGIGGAVFQNAEMHAWLFEQKRP